MRCLRLFAAAVTLWTLVLPGRTQAQDPGGFRGLPAMVCVDRRTSPLCKNEPRSGGKLATLRAALPEAPFMPMIACELPDASGPCSRKSCGDKVCSFGEIGQCPIDCPVPAKVDLCLCDKPGVACRAFQVECDTVGCKSTVVAAEGTVCSCQGPETTQQCKSASDTVCQVMRFSAPTTGCELVRYRVGAQRSFVHCTHESCPPEGFGLADDDLPIVERTKVDSAKE